MLSANWQPFHLVNGERVAAYLGDLAARIDTGPGRRDALVESVLPLRSRDEAGSLRPVDLDLENRGGYFASDNPLVRARLNQRLEAGITLDDIGVSVVPQNAGAGGPSALLVSGKAFYANVATDSDFFVKPIPAGLETYWQLRSADSPEVLTLDFNLPAGVSLRTSVSDPAAIEIVRGLHVLATLPPPAAYDADGAPIPVAQTIADADTVSFGISHRGGDWAYPLLVDPGIAENYQAWHDGTATDYSGWTRDGNLAPDPQDPPVSGDPPWPVFNPLHGYFRITHTQADQLYGPGLYVIHPSASSPGVFSKGDYGEWLYVAPGTSYVYKADFQQWFNPSPTATASACAISGIYHKLPVPSFEPAGAYRSDCGPAVVTDQKRLSCADPTGYPDGPLPCSSQVGVAGNLAFLGAWTYWTGSDSTKTFGKFTSYAGSAAIYQSDRDDPTITGDSRTGLAVGWNRSGTDQASITTTDSGLGVKSVSVAVPQDGAAPATVTGTHGCTGDRRNRCPASWQEPPNHSWTKTLSYDVAGMPEGINTVAATAEDVIGNTSGATSWQVKVDRTAPEYEMSGSLPGAQGRPLYDSTYELNVAATDTDAGHATAGVRDIVVTVDGTEATRVDQTCPTTQDGCPLDLHWSMQTASYSEGQHTIEVSITDRAGNVGQESWLVYVPGPAETLPPEIRPASDGQWGMRINGATAGDNLGASTSRLGDLNGDAIDDFAIGAPGASPRGRAGAGTVWVVFGRQSDGGTLDLQTLPSSDGFRIDGAAAGDHAGASVASGDINGDGVPDMVIGVPRTTSSPVTHGAVMVVFGSASSQDRDLAALGTQGFVIEGPQLTLPPPPIGRQPQPFGARVDVIRSIVEGPDLTPPTESTPIEGVEAKRDFNGDGLEDIVVGASAASNNLRLASGSAYVVFGKTDTATVSLDSLSNRGVRIDGAQLTDLAGFAVAAVGDVNADGRGDVGIGAPGHNELGATNAGAAYIVYGRDAPGVLDLASAGSGAWRLDGVPNDQLGVSVTGLGDIDRDGYGDVAAAGRAAFVAFGGRLANTHLASDTTHGVRIDGVGADLTVARVGDQDQDGIDDLGVGTPGSSWVVFGAERPGSRSLAALPGQHGRRYDAPADGQGFGSALAGVQHATEADAANQLVGAPTANPGGRSGAGSAFLLYGDWRLSCAESYSPTPAEMDARAVVICTDGDNTVGVSTPSNSQLQTRQTSQVAAGAASHGGSAGGNRKAGQRDTYLSGSVYGNRSIWQVVRTGVIAELSRSGVREIGRVRLRYEIMLRGRQSLHSGYMYPDGGVLQKPRAFMSCLYGSYPSYFPCGFRVSTADTIFKTATRYSNTASPGNGVRFARTQRYQYRSGRYRWHVHWSALIQYHAIQNVEFPPFFRSTSYYCPADPDDQCLFPG